MAVVVMQRPREGLHALIAPAAVSTQPRYPQHDTGCAIEAHLRQQHTGSVDPLGWSNCRADAYRLDAKPHEGQGPRPARGTPFPVLHIVRQEMFAIEEGVFAVGRETEMTRFDWVRNQFRQRFPDDLFGPEAAGLVIVDCRG